MNQPVGQPRGDMQVMPPRSVPGKGSALDRLTQELGFAQPRRISTEGKRFALVDLSGTALPCNLVDQQLGFYMDVVIADANEHKSKIFWGHDKVYQSNSTEPPLCFSDNGVAPSTNAVEPQSQTCVTCPNNMIGSAISKKTGANIRACADRKKIAVFVVGAPTNDLYQLNVPPASLKALGAHGAWLRQNGKNPWEVITRVCFDPNADNALLFYSVGEVPLQYIELVRVAEEQGLAITVCGRDDVARPIDMPIEPRAQLQGQHPGQQALPRPINNYPPQQAPAPQHHVPQPSYPPQQAPQPSYPPPQPPQNQFTQQQAPAPQAGQPPAPKAGRGGARAGAGRRTAPTPQPAPTHAPFQQAGQMPQGGGFGAAPPSATLDPRTGQPWAPGATIPQPGEARAAYPPPQGDGLNIPDFTRKQPEQAPSGQQGGFGGPPQQAAPPPPNPAPAGQPQYGMAPGAAPDPRTAAALAGAFAHQPGAPQRV